MQLKANQLEAQLQKNLLPIYLISGDDPLLKQEARDAIIRVAHAQGFLAHDKIMVEGRFNWDQLNGLGSNQDLFSAKKLIEITNPEAKFDAKAAKILSEYCANCPPETLWIIVSGKLNSTQTRATWYQHIDKTGACLTLWPLNPQELNTWLVQRFNRVQLKANPEALKLLAELCENNLLAMQQAIEKLKLLYPEQAQINQEHVIAAVSDHSRYTIFDLVNYALLGDTPQLLHVLSVLRQQGSEPTLILWVLAKEIRTLLDLLEQRESGQNIQRLIEREIFTKRAFLQSAVRRVTIPQLKNLLSQLTEVDQNIKGVKSGDVWLSLSRLGLGLTGAHR